MAYTNCESTLDKGEVLCADTHCNNYAQTSTMKRVCYCRRPDGSTIDGCQVKGDSFPVSTTECWNKVTGERKNITPEACDELRDNDRNWTNRTCFCCCSCFAWGTRVALGNGEEREIQEVGVGEAVLAGSPRLVDGALQLSWTARPVIYSDGTSPAPGQTAVLIQYAGEGELVVTTDQPFLMPDGTLKRADRLTVDDRLVNHQGDAVAIDAVYLGKARIGLHSISAEAGGEDELDGHLIVANGVVAGDHTVRLLQNAPGFREKFAPGHDELPVLGTDEYAEALAGGTTSLFASVGGETAQRPLRTRAFVPLQEIVSASVPFGAAPFVTREQARLLKKHGDFAPPATPVNVAEFHYLRRLFASFFPGVLFHLDWESLDPNAYAFEAYGVRVVQVSGQLLRARPIRREGLAFIMAQGAARFAGGPPSDDDGMACTGQADYYALGYMFIDAFFTAASKTGLAALSQVKEVFEWIPAEGGKGTDRCANPGIPCRLQAMNDALAGLELPRCAGAPEPGSLRLERAEVRVVDEVSAVVATFSAPLLPASVGNVANYSIRPVSAVTVAEVNAYDPRQVVLNVVFPEGAQGTFTLGVANLLASDGATLDPNASRVEFEVAPRDS